VHIYIYTFHTCCENVENSMLEVHNFGRFQGKSKVAPLLMLLLNSTQQYFHGISSLSVIDGLVKTQTDILQTEHKTKLSQR